MEIVTYQVDLTDKNGSRLGSLVYGTEGEAKTEANIWCRRKDIRMVTITEIRRIPIYIYSRGHPLDKKKLDNISSGPVE